MDSDTEPVFETRLPGTGGDGPVPDGGPGASPGEEPPVDLGTALRTVGGDVPLLEELIGSFLGDLPERRATLRDAVAARDARQTEMSAHSLKGVLQILGSRRAHLAARELEELGRSRRLAEAAEVLARVESALDAVAAFYHGPWKAGLCGS